MPATANLVDLPILSDNLSGLREVFGVFPVLAEQLGDPKNLRLVLDANVVIAEVRWLVKKRRNPSARTSLQEAVASGTLVAFAPTFLNDEVRRQLYAIAEEEGLSYQALLDAWESYQTALTFYDAPFPVSPTSKDVVDPKDMPYVEAYLAIGAAAIMTADPHLKRMGARTVSSEISVKMRSYARDASIDLTLRTGGALVATAIVAGTIGLAKTGANMATLVSRLPRSLQALVVVALISLIAYRPTREALVRGLRRTQTGISDAFDVTTPLFLDLVKESRNHRASAELAWSEIQPLIPSRKVGLAAQTLAICAEARKPLTGQEILGRLKRVGARTTARTFPRYLQQILRSHPQLAKTEDGSWVVRRPG
jgi:predicted nucleic acid-binding protein